MKTASNTAGRKATNVTIEATLLARAKAMNINISQASERGIAAAVAAKDEENWLKNNQQAIASSNAYVEKHGLPLARFRNF